jgi:enoyl-CoA hydratase
MGVTLQHDGGLALLTLDDGKSNALSPSLIAEITRALDATEADDAVRALVITGREGRFCAGFDLSVMGQGPAAVRELVGAGGRLALRLYDFPRPVVIACSGHAMAMGAILLCTADWRTGGHGNYRIGMNEVAIGMVMPHFGQELARARLSPRYLDRAVVNAEILSPALAVEAGFLDEAVDDLSVLDLACAQADRLGTLNRHAFVTTRRRVREATRERIARMLDADIAALTGG